MPRHQPTQERNGTLFIAVFVIVGIILAVFTAAIYIKTDVGGSEVFWKQQDIYYAYVEGCRIATGQNPYARIVGQSMEVNQKYATYFPGFYLLSAGTVIAGARDFNHWIAIWRPIFALFHWGIGLLLLFAFMKRDQWVLGIFASAYWTLGRFGALVLWIGHIEPFAVFFLVASLLILRRRPLVAYCLFGISLAIKQIAIFVLPVFLIWSWHSNHGLRPGLRLRKVLLAGLAIGFIPFLLSLPFIVANPEGFVRSVVFSATRVSSLLTDSQSLADPRVILNLPSVDTLLNLRGLPARAIMGSVLLLVYASYLRRRIGFFTAVSFVMCIFLGFNTVVFLQYSVWPVPLLPLMLFDFLPESAPEGNRPAVKK